MSLLHSARTGAAGLACLCGALVAPSPAHDGASPHGHVAPAGEMGTARASHTSTLLPDGRVLIAGGFPGSSGEGSMIASTELFDPATGRFAAGRAMRVGRTGHTATLLPNGKVLVVGGWTGRFQAAAAAELYDPVAGTFADAGAMATPRADQTATLLADGRVLIAGGTDPQMNALSTAELFDPRTGRFLPTGDLALARFSHTATRLADGRVLIVGGGSGRREGKVLHADAELYDPALGRFTRAGALGTPRHKHAAVLLADGSVLVIGGSDTRDWGGRLASAERYVPGHDARIGAFVAAASPHDTRFKFADAVVRLADGRVVVAGGAVGVEVYDPASATFGPAGGSLGAARFFSTATALGDGRVLVAGGYAQERGGLPATARAYVYKP